MPLQRQDEPQAANRSTEGPKPGVMSYGKNSNQNRGGRPPGAKNKPKSLIPLDLAKTILGLMDGQVPKEHLEYMTGVIEQGKTIATKKELDVLITLVRAGLMTHLINEAVPVLEVDEETGEQSMKVPNLNRDVTDRLKLLNSLLTLRNSIEKATDDDQPKGAQQPLLQIFADRRLDTSRLRVLVGVEPSDLAGGDDGAGRRTVSVGGVPNPVPERPLALQSGEQEPTDWVLDHPGRRSDGEDGDAEGLPG